MRRRHLLPTALLARRDVLMAYYGANWITGENKMKKITENKTRTASGSSKILLEAIFRLFFTKNTDQILYITR